MTIETSGGTSRNTSTLIDINSFGPRRARVTIKHWQLRDLICKTALPNEILYVSDRFVKSMDIKTGKSVKCAEFPFEPRCIATSSRGSGNGDSIIATGGIQRGQFGISYRPEQQQDGYSTMNPVTAVELGGSINNSITLFNQGSASVSALVCNNDHSLRMLDISPTGHSVVDKICLPVPLNHASMSPDGNTIITCGDSPQLFVFHPEERSNSLSNRRSWTRSITLPTSSDSGFSTAFSPSGVLFAVAAQDGVASIFDSRFVSSSSTACKPLKMIESTRPRTNAGAFRCLKFTPGAEDLLLITEQSGRVHVVDARKFEDRQVLDIPNTNDLLPPRSSNHLAGGTVSNHMRHVRLNQGSWADDQAGFDNGSDDDVEEDNDGDDDEGNMIHDDYYYEHSTAAGRGSSTNRFLASIVDPHHRLSGSRPMQEKEVSGIAWSEEDGGMVVVGWNNGIGTWNVDNWGRRVFPAYNMR
ncbi:WD40-repeat-containing domain protein [Lipomyces japonicus]|uniref:WD40-repeat-containing domain protein n=1 Tax=Lipomyces japonicus TaxID=56871 RepID=UPI0034CECC8F